MPDKLYLHAATSLHLASWRYVPAFLRATKQVEAAVKRLPGYRAHQLRTNLLRKIFRTYTVYDDRAALGLLMASEEHRHAVSQFPKWGLPDSKVVSWESANPHLDWPEAERRLQQALPLGEKYVA